jgi:transposase
MEIARKPYPSDVSDDEWALIAPYLTLLPEDAGQRAYPLREAFNGLRYIIKTGVRCRMICRPGQRSTSRRGAGWRGAVSKRCWTTCGRCCARLWAVQRSRAPSSSTPAPCVPRRKAARAGYDGGKRKKGSKLHIAVDTLGNLLALRVTPANADERVEVGPLTRTVQAVSDNNVDVAFVDQGYDGPNAAEAAAANDVELIVVKLPKAKKGFVLLPRRWVVERTFAWATRFRRLVRDYERYASTLAGVHLVAFVCLMLKKAALLAAGS